MAKTSLIQRELKRDALVAKFAKKYAELKATANDAKTNKVTRVRVFKSSGAEIKA